MEKYRISSGNFNDAYMKDIKEFRELEKVISVLGALNAIP